MRLGRRFLLVLAWLPVIAGCATPPPLDGDRLAAELARRPVVLLGEVHDNVVQHRDARRSAAPACWRAARGRRSRSSSSIASARPTSTARGASRRRTGRRSPIT